MSSILSSCDCYLCLANFRVHFPANYSLCNPHTKLISSLPHPPWNTHSFLSFNKCFIPVCQTLKLLSLGFVFVMLSLIIGLSYLLISLPLLLLVTSGPLLRQLLSSSFRLGLSTPILSKKNEISQILLAKLSFLMTPFAALVIQLAQLFPLLFLPVVLMHFSSHMLNLRPPLLPILINI